MKKTPVKPIWVSDVKPVYDVKGRVFCWNIRVMFDGDLALWHNEKPLPRNVQDFKKYMNLTDADVERIEDEDDDVHGGHRSIESLFYEFKKDCSISYISEIPYVLNSELDIPQRNNISTVDWDKKSVKGDNKYANTLVGYVFFKGWFGLGYKRAQNFKNKMQAQIDEQKLKDLKAHLKAQVSKRENEKVK